VNADAWIDRLSAALDPLERAGDAERSDYDLNGGAPGLSGALKPAAVLAPLVEREGELFVVLTERQKSLPRHAGQVSFPGGRPHAGDEGLFATALRETHEEIGAPPHAVTPLGWWEGYETVTGYHVTPFMGLLDPATPLTPDPGEVAQIFEAPLGFLMDPANHQRQWRDWNGQRRYFYAMPYGDCFIWGATAGMLKALSDRLLEHD